jgi:hypothetical protein
MAKIAVDIALLLPDKIEDLCIRINKEFERIRPLGKKDYKPHITLAMGIIDKKDVKPIQNYLKSIKAKPLEISADKIRYRKTTEGNKSSLEVKNTKELQKLHEKVLKNIKQYLHKGADADMLYKGDETGIKESTKLWLDKFSEETAFEKYSPHISLSCYDAKTKLPIKFKVDTIAFCHAGDGVTCRKIISSYKLI